MTSLGGVIKICICLTLNNYETTLSANMPLCMPDLSPKKYISEKIQWTFYAMVRQPIDVTARPVSFTSLS